MKDLAKALSMQGDDFHRYAVSLVAVELKGGWRDCEPNWDSERRKLVGYDPVFHTVQTFGSEELASARAKESLDGALARLRAAGFTLLCAPKTVDDEHHDWRRICRVRTPRGKRVALIAKVEYIAAYFDPWMY